MLLSKAAQLSANFGDFQVLKSKFVKFLMPILNCQVNSSSNFTSFFIVMTHNSPVNFKPINFQNWTKGYHQGPNFETFKCSGEILPNSSFHFWKYKSVFLQTLYQSWVLWNVTPLYFLSSNFIYFGQKQPIKVQSFEIFEFSGQNLLNSSCKFWTGKSVPFQILHHSSLSEHVTPL